MKVGMISAGAAGMLCGACIHDNTLAAALQRLGHDAALIPLYTPMRTDETNVSMDRVFFGAVNVYLQSRSRWFARLPGFLHRWLDRRSVLEYVSRFSASSDARDLGRLTVTMLEGEDGNSASELEALVDWLRSDLRPDVVQLQNSMLLGVARRVKQELGVPVVCSLLGEEIFLDDLIEPYRTRARQVLYERVHDADAFLCGSSEYADFMADYLHVERERIHIVPFGLLLQDFDPPGTPLPRATVEAAAEEPPFAIGFLARICPEKGLHILVEAFRQLAEQAGKSRVRLRIAGYLGPKDQAYAAEQMARLQEWGLAEQVEMLGEVDRAGKLALLRSVDAVAVPTVYRESKGLSLLEAQAAGVPVVVPHHGVFPEMLERTGGGLLVEPESADAVAAALMLLMRSREHRHSMGERARKVVHTEHSDEAMARRTLDIYEKLVTQAAGRAA